jgi:hypothetical protein
MKNEKRKMKNENSMKTRLFFVFAFILLFSRMAFSQYVPDGEKVIKCLGQEVMSNDVLDMILVFEMKDDVVPDVKAGGGLTFYSPGGKVQRIGFQNNKDYGTYPGKLPFGLSFENTGKDILAKYPNANVNEDYQSFYIDNLTVSVKFSSTKQKKIEFIQVF